MFQKTCTTQCTALDAARLASEARPHYLQHSAESPISIYMLLKSLLQGLGPLLHNVGALTVASSEESKYPVRGEQLSQGRRSGVFT